VFLRDIAAWPRGHGARGISSLSMPTLGQWLTDQRTSVPETLWRQLDACVTVCDARENDLLEGLRCVTDAQLVRLGELSGEERGDALDLLAADAWVTYLLELAATERVDDLDAFAEALMTKITRQ
jgi:hypothetical protein